MMNTRAGVKVPAAVMSSGKNFCKRLAAKSTALYPETVLMALKTSMDWARVIRGINSMAKAVALRAARALIISGWL